jgi:hypothetical protein
MYIYIYIYSKIKLHRYAELSAAFYLIHERLESQNAGPALFTLTYMWTEVSRGIAALGHQLGGEKQGAIFVLNLLLHIRAVYYDLGVCAGACKPLRTMIDTYQATISCFHSKVSLYA